MLPLEAIIQALILVFMPPLPHEDLEDPSILFNKGLLYSISFMSFADLYFSGFCHIGLFDQ